MFNYERDFYRQSGDFYSALSFGGSSGEFGLSGDNQLEFKVLDRALSVDGYFLDSISDNESILAEVYGDSSGMSIFLNGFPAYHKNVGVDFSSVYCNGINDALFSELIKANKTIPELTFSGWDTYDSGVFVLSNPDGGDLNVSSLKLYGVAASISSPSGSFQVSPYSSGIINVVRNEGASGSGSFLFNMQSNLGVNEFALNLEIQQAPKIGYMNLSSSGDIIGDSGYIDFLLTNYHDEDKDVEIFLDYINGSGASYFDTESSGLFNYSVNEIIERSKTYNIGYTGVFTGTGGRLSNTDTNTDSGVYGLTVYPSGDVLVSRNIKYFAEESLIPVFVEIITDFSGNTSSGIYSFEEYPSVSGITRARKVSDNTWMDVSTATIFNGEFIENYPLIDLVSGDYATELTSRCSIYEGERDFPDFWNVIVHDVDFGDQDFTTNGYIDDDLLGQSGIFYRVPANTTISGKITYLSDYQKKSPRPASSLRVVEPTSINHSISIYPI